MYLAECVEIIVEDEPKKDKVLAKCYFISFFSTVQKHKWTKSLIYTTNLP